MSLKIKNKKGKVVAVLEDQSTEPELEEDLEVKEEKCLQCEEVEELKAAIKEAQTQHQAIGEKIDDLIGQLTEKERKE